MLKQNIEMGSQSDGNPKTLADLEPKELGISLGEL